MNQPSEDDLMATQRSGSEGLGVERPGVCGKALWLMPHRGSGVLSSFH